MKELFKNTFKEEEIDVFKFGGPEYIELWLRAAVKDKQYSTNLRPKVLNFLKLIFAAYDNDYKKIANEIYKLSNKA